MSSEDLDIRKQAAMALGESDAREAVDLLLEAAQDNELSVRYFARKALKKLKEKLNIKEEELESNLEKVYIERQMSNLDNQDPQIRIQAALKLAEFKDPELLPRIIEQLHAEEHKYVIATLVKTIGILGDECVIPVLSPYLKDADSRVRANTIEALEAVQVAKTFNLVSPLLNDSNPRVVANAAKTLWNFSPLKAMTRLREMSRNHDVTVRKSAVFALSRIGTVEARRLLSKLLSDQDMDVRLQASMAIAKVDEKLAKKETGVSGTLRRTRGEESATAEPVQEHEESKEYVDQVFQEKKPDTRVSPPVEPAPTQKPSTATVQKPTSADIEAFIDEAFHDIDEVEVKGEAPAVKEEAPAVKGKAPTVKEEAPGRDISVEPREPVSRPPELQEPASQIPPTELQPAPLEAIPKSGEPVHDPTARPTSPAPVLHEIPAELAAILPESPVEQVIKDIDSEDEEIRLRAVQEASELGDPEILPLLVDRLSLETSRYVIATLVKAVGNLGGTSVVEQIVPFLDYPDPRVRANAVEGLAMANDPEMAYHIAPLLGDQDNRVRGNVATYLWNKDPDVAREKIEAMLKSPSVWDRESALYAIEKIRDESLNPLLKKLLRDKSLTIVRKAASLLSTMDDSSKSQSPAPAAAPKPPPAQKVPQPYMQAVAASSTSSSGAGKKIFLSVLGILVAIGILSGGFILGIRLAAKARDKDTVKVASAPTDSQKAKSGKRTNKKPARRKPSSTKRPRKSGSGTTKEAAGKGEDTVVAMADSPDTSGSQQTTATQTTAPPPETTTTSPDPKATADDQQEPDTTSGQEIPPEAQGNPELTLEEALAMRDILGDDSIELPPPSPEPTDDTSADPVAEPVVVVPSQPQPPAPVVPTPAPPKPAPDSKPPVQDTDNSQPPAEPPSQDTGTTAGGNRLTLPSGLFLPRPPTITRSTSSTSPPVTNRNTEELKEKAFAFMDKGDMMSSLKTFKEIINIDPQNPEALYYCGHILVGERKYEESLDFFSKVIEVDPKYADAYFMKGRALYVLGKLDQAIASYNTGLKIRPSDIPAMNELADIFERANKLDQAAELLEKAIKSIKTPNLKFRLGRIYLMTNRQEQAKTLAETMTKEHPQAPEGYNLLGEIYLGEENLDQASQYLEKGIQLKETTAGHRLLAKIQLGRHAYGAARQHLNHVVKHTPNDQWALFNRGRILRLFGDLDGAIPDLERALALDPNDIITQAHLGDCYLLKKRFNDASGLYQRALELQPSSNIEGELRERLSLAKRGKVPGSLPSVW